MIRSTSSTIFLADQLSSSRQDGPARHGMMYMDFLFYIMIKSHNLASLGVALRRQTDSVDFVVQLDEVFGSCYRSFRVNSTMCESSEHCGGRNPACPCDGSCIEHLNFIEVV